MANYISLCKDNKAQLYSIIVEHKNETEIE